MKHTCTKCGQEKIDTDFPLSGDGKGGRRKQCCLCMRQINIEWRQKNKQRIATYNKSRPKRGQEKVVEPTQTLAQAMETRPVTPESEKL